MPPHLLMLRRSVVGSLRSLTGNRRPSSPSTPTPDTLTVPDPVRDNRRASILSQSTIRSQTEVDKSTATLTRRETLIPVDPTLRDNPYYDRSVDLLATASPEDIAIDQEEVFEQLVRSNYARHRLHPLSALPADVRHRICSFCFDGDEQRKISLSPKFATRAVFPDGYFANAWDVLDPVFGALHSFRALREDLLSYFWTTYHFHVSLNPFSGPKFSPLSHIWLYSYLDRVQKLTIEADFTRFGGSSLRIAPAFGNNQNKVEDMLYSVIGFLLDRPDRLSIAELNIMSRRYGGFRPFTPEIGSATIKYCPEESLQLCDVMCELRGMLQRCRISGFSLSHTKHILTSVFAEGDQIINFIVPKDDPWPYIPEPSPTPSSTRSHTPSSSADISAFGLRLPRSRSFTEEFEEEMSRNSFYSCYTAIPEDSPLLLDEPFPSLPLMESTLTDHDREIPIVRASTISTSTIRAPTESTEEASTPRFQHLKLGEMMISQSVEVTNRPPSEASAGTPTPGLENLQPGKVDLAHSSEVTMSPIPKSSSDTSMPVFENSQPGEVVLTLSPEVAMSPTPKSSAEPSTPGLENPQPEETLLTQSSEVMHSPISTPITDTSTPGRENLQRGGIVLTQSFEVTSRCRTPIPKKPIVPESPNSLNKLNESDPAFIRTVSAIKTHSQIEANEQDPAFIRTISAMRSPSGSQSSTPSHTSSISVGNRPKSMLVPKPTKIPSPTRAATSMSSRTSESIGTVKRRYMSFVERLQRGRSGAQS